ncbi:MAG: xanthine dehydrogenase family protein molybdopterin-binding subunit, partial [Nitrososphaerota archaeon]|nr:xanthine dehydrogenase family protein molybdopterin-binding subunit [Nitrososphaerota archaeon]
MSASEARLLVSGESPPKLGREFTIIGRDIDRLEGADKATGTATYAGDMKFEGTLHAKILRSPHAHARILKIDTSDAERLPGVRAVISKNNCEGWNTYWYTIQQPAFPEEVGFYGQEVAAVAAETIEIARKALELIRVEYKVLPAVFDTEEAMKPGAPIVPSLDQVDQSVSRAPHARPVGNVFEGKPHIMKRGDVESGFKEADIIVEGSFDTNFQFHAALQTRSCISVWDGETLTVYDSSQGPWQVKDDLSRSLKIPIDKVRVQVKFMGGGFGSKAGAQRFIHFASKLSMMTKRPVRLELTRPEEFLAHPHRQSSKSWMKIGAKKDGKLCAIQARIIVNLGMGSTYGAQGDKAIEHAFELYECSNAYVEQIGVHTNTPLTGYMRSVMRVIGNFPLESMMDELASKLGIDPAEFRLKNYTIYGDQSEKIKYSAKNLDRCIRKAVEESGWKEKRLRYRKENGESKSSVKRGIGMASYIYEGVGLPPFRANARVQVDKSGEATVFCGFVDIGGGQTTMATMLVAEELGMELKDVRVHWGDTDQTEYSPGTHASRMTAEMGPAILQAAYNARKQVFQLASKRLSVPTEDLRSALGKIYSKSSPEKSTTFAEVCKDIKSPNGTIEGKGSRAANPKDVAFKTFGTQVAEIEIDTDTGQIRVVRITSAHELGRALNPKFCISQHYGAINMGLGFAMYENPVLDKKTGILLNTDLHQYRLVSAPEAPEI